MQQASTKERGARDDAAWKPRLAMQREQLTFSNARQPARATVSRAELNRDELALRVTQLGEVISQHEARDVVVGRFGHGLEEGLGIPQ
jgi:hypothetical protein